MNFTAWKIWGAAESWQRNWLPVVGAGLIGVGLSVFTHDWAFVPTAAAGCVALLLYLPIALGISFGPLHKFQSETHDE